MILKNISIKIEKDRKIPSKKTYIIIHKSEEVIDIHQKFIDSTENQRIELKVEECKRLMNLLYHFVFQRNYKYSKDKAIIYREHI